MRKQGFISKSFESFFSFIILTSFLSGALPLAAQTRKAAKRTPSKTTVSKVADKQNNSKCSGGWSGTITFSKTLNENDGSESPGIRGGRDNIKQEWSRNMSYAGRMTVDGSLDPRTPKAFGNVEFGDARMQHSVEKVWDSCHAFNDEHWFIIDNKREEMETGSGAGNAESFNLYVDEFGGTYNFSFRFPEVPGKWGVEDHTKRTGHCQPKNNEPIDLSDKRETRITGEGGVVEGRKIDPKNPNVLAGTVTLDDNDYSNPKRVKTPITVISWKFKRCSPPLMITEVKFFQPQFPSPNTWTDIGEDEWTIDGNQVKITATIVNLSGEQKTANVQFKELTENTILPEGNKTETFAPHEEKEVELIWDTSGYAWKEANVWNQPQMKREIEVRIPDDAMTELIAVKPKPVVIVPGLWSSPDSMGKLLNYFKNLEGTEWTTALAPVYVRKIAAENANVIDKTVRDLQKRENAWHVDLVAHSTGGLMARAYVNSEMPQMFDGRPAATHLVMIGTPNTGTPCSTGIDTIFTKIFSRSEPAFNEIAPKNMLKFNQTITNRNGTKFAALVGNSVAPICQLDAPGDGITPNASAIWTIKTWKFSTVRARHEFMPGEQSNFMQIVNWLAVPPKGDHAPDTSASLIKNNFSNDFYADMREENFGKSRFYGAMFHNASFAANSGNDEPEPNFATGVKLAANETKEIEIPVTNGSRLSLILYAAPDISATLTDDKGEVVGENLTGTTEADDIFRTITVKKPFSNGKWKLRLKSRARVETEVAVTAFIDYNSKIFAAN